MKFKLQNCKKELVITPYILRKSKTSGDIGDAPDVIKRTRPPNFAFILLKTRRSQIGDGVFPDSRDYKIFGFSMQKTSVSRIYLFGWLVSLHCKQY